MADRPILFTAEMVRSLIAGRKTKTRRIAKARRGTTLADCTVDAGPGPGGIGRRWEVAVEKLAMPYAVGDRLWVREAHYLTDDGDYERAVCAVDDAEVRDHLSTVEGLKASHPQTNWRRHARLRSGIHMHRWASRLTLTVTSIAIERLQDVTDTEAQAEGADPWPWGEWFETSPGETINQGLVPPRVKFAALWQRIHGPGSWNDNPWVHVVGFDVGRHNIDRGA